MTAPGRLDLSWVLSVSRREDLEIPVAVALHVVAEAIKDLDYSPGSPLDSGLWGRVVHGDIRPGRIQVDIAGAVDLAPPSRQWGREMEQLRYAAPEVAGGEGAGPRSDVFALGVLIFELITGTPLYTHESPGELAVALSEGFDPASRVAPAAAALGDLAGLVARALAADPGARYASADVLLEEIVGHLKPLDGPPPTELLADLVRRVFELSPLPPPEPPPARDPFDEPSLPGVAAAFDAVSLGDVPRESDEGGWEPLHPSWNAVAEDMADPPDPRASLDHPWSEDEEDDDEAAVTLPTLEVSSRSTPAYAGPDQNPSWAGDESMPPAPWERDVSSLESSGDLEPRGGLDEASLDRRARSAAGASSDDVEMEIFDPSIIDLQEVSDGPDAPSLADGRVGRSGVDPYQEPAAWIPAQRRREAEDPAPEPPPVGGGAFLFAGGKAMGPLSLLDMEQQLVRLRDPCALVAFEKGAWRPLSECASLLPRRPTRVQRRSFHLFELGPLLLELGAGPRLQRVSLWHEDDAAVLEVADGQVWEAHAASVPSMARTLLREEDLLSTEDLDTVEIVEDDRRTLDALRHRGLLTAGQVARLMRRRARRTLAAPFDWPHGEFVIHDTGRAPRAGANGVDLAQAIAFVVRSHRDPALVEGLFYQMRDRDAVQASRSLRHQLPLMPGEERLLAELPDRTSVSDALGSYWEEGREEAFSALFLCVELGLITLV